MVDDDNRADGNLDPETEVAGSDEHQGPRRSTWAPSSSAFETDSSTMSDDDLARALEEDFERITHTGVVPIDDPFDAMPDPDTDPDPDTEPEPEPEPESEPEPEPEPEAEDATGAVDESSAVESEPTFVYPLDDVPLSEEFDSGLQVPPSNFGPGPESEPLVDVSPGASLELPVRQSLRTSELAATLAEKAESGEDPGEIMAQLEEQLRLREQDATDFRQWHESKVADGSPEALAAVESAREDFGDIVEGLTPSPSAAPPVESNPVLETHTFRVDDVLDIELTRAPAPRTAPVSDLPPPPGHVLSPPAPPLNPTPMTESEDAAPPPVDPTAFDDTAETAQPPLIPDLVEPAEGEAKPDVFDFDSLIGGTGSILDDGVDDADVDAVVDTEVDSEINLDVDADEDLADVMGPFPVTSEGVAIVPGAPVAAVHATWSQPLLTGNPITANPVIDEQLLAPPAFRVEESSVEPTVTDQRVGRSARLFWLWFAANSSIVSLAFGGAVLSLGMSLRQAIVATLIGVAVSFLPLGLGTLAGKWSGQPTMIVSRATFGHVGNILPAVLAIIVRVFWGAVLLWFLAAGTARILTGAELGGPLSENQLVIIGLAVGFLLALVIAFFGYGLIARIQMVFTIIAALLIVGLIVITWPAVDFPAALTVVDGPWILVLTGAVLVFSFVGLVWAVSSADLARYQRKSSSGAASMLWSTFGATIPAFVLIAYGALLAASNPDVAVGLMETPLDTIALLIPVWYPIPLIAALAFSLLSGVVISIYSGGFALQATGASMRRIAAVVIVGAAVAVLAILIAVSVGDFTLILRDVATTLAVPIAAWAGIFGAEMMIRNKRFSSAALLKRGGVYADVRWVNVSMLVVASAIGFGLTTASVSWLSWQGYLFKAAGVPLSGDLAGTDIGVFVALVLGLLTPLVVGFHGIRAQEGKTVQQPHEAGD